MKKRALTCFLALCLALSLLPAGALAASAPAGNGCPYYIAVDRTYCTVTVYTLDSAGRYTVPVRVMVCSVGRTGHATPSGTYKISTRAEWGAMVDGTYAQYAVRFNGPILFHSVCYTAPQKDKLITSEYNALGQPASLGCVRLQTADAKWIYDNCQSGTLVKVFDGTAPGPLGVGVRAVNWISDAQANGWDPTDPAAENPWGGVTTGALSFTRTALTLTAGQSAALGAQLTPVGLDKSKLTYTSSDPAVATVTASGQVVALSAGTAVITGQFGSLTAQATVQVSGALLPYDDVTPGAWYYDHIRYVVDHGLLVGTGERQFQPEYRVTRAMLAQLLYQRGGQTDLEDAAPEALPYTDLPEEGWYLAAVRWAAGQGVLSGRTDTEFGPQDEVARQEVVIALCRLLGEDLSAADTAVLDGYTDRDALTEEGAAALALAVSQGWITGTSQTTLSPDDPLTRAQWAVILHALEVTAA